MFLSPIRNIVDFYNKVSQILDTQSKKTLWKFILLKLTPPHQEYCLNRINLSEEVLLGKQPFPHPHRKPVQLSKFHLYQGDVDEQVLSNPSLYAKLIMALWFDMYKLRLLHSRMLYKGLKIIPSPECGGIFIKAYQSQTITNQNL